MASHTAVAQSSFPERNPSSRGCEAVVQAEIDRIQLPRSRIERIQISPQTQDIRDNRRTVGFDGWVRLNDCPGSVVVDMDTSCGVRQVYARGMCEVPGVKTFD